MKRVLLIALMFVFLLALPAFGQQTYVTRYDFFSGYSFLNSPKVNLFENGYSSQVGFRPKTWLSFGFDYSISGGDLKITPDLLTTNLQQQLGGQLHALAVAGKLPPGYTLTVPAHSKTQTFAVGPQLAYRHFKTVTIFVRPVFAGLIHETATPQPAAGDPIAAGIVAQLAPSGKKTNTTPFFGFGGGFDINFGHHFAWRTQADLVYDHLFDDLLKDGRFTTRFAVGPAFNFGKNIAKNK